MIRSARAVRAQLLRTVRGRHTAAGVEPSLKTAQSDKGRAPPSGASAGPSANDSSSITTKFLSSPLSQSGDLADRNDLGGDVRLGLLEVDRCRGGKTPLVGHRREQLGERKRAVLHFERHFVVRIAHNVHRSVLTDQIVHPAKQTIADGLANE